MTPLLAKVKPTCDNCEKAHYGHCFVTIALMHDAGRAAPVRASTKNIGLRCDRWVREADE